MEEINSDAEERERCREETETLAILTGLEIDSAKSGIRPDLDEYLTHKAVKRSDFLKYKTLVEEMETRRAWYEPTHAAKVKTFFKKVDWSKVDSNDDKFLALAVDDIRRHLEDYAEHEPNPNLWQGLFDALEAEQRARATRQARKIRSCPPCGKSSL